MLQKPEISPGEIGHFARMQTLPFMNYKNTISHFQEISTGRALKPCATNALHTVAAPAIRAAVKTELSYRNDRIIVFLFVANRNKDNAKVSLASSNT